MKSGLHTFTQCFQGILCKSDVGRLFVQVAGSRSRADDDNLSTNWFHIRFMVSFVTLFL